MARGLGGDADRGTGFAAVLEALAGAGGVSASWIKTLRVGLLRWGSLLSVPRANHGLRLPFAERSASLQHSRIIVGYGGP